MRRQDKYPDTKTFHFHIANPKGKFTADCEVRAISTATGVEYNEVVRGLAETQIRTGYAIGTNENTTAYLATLGYRKNNQPRKWDNTKYTGEEFCETFAGCDDADGIVANIGGHHAVCIKRYNGDLKVWDTWNSTEGCIGNYWSKAR